jgi:uncharacterized DUF497 family protein
VLFEWDPAKSERCLREPGFAFVHIVPAFADPDRHVDLDDRFDYGEPRFRLLGRIGGRLHVVVFTYRGAVCRIISARKANAHERQEHDARAPRR